MYNIQKDKFIVMSNICKVLYVIQFFLRNNNWYKKNFKSIYSLWIWRNDSPYVIPVHAGDEDLPLVVVYKQPSDHFVIFFASYNKLLK